MNQIVRLWKRPFAQNVGILTVTNVTVAGLSFVQGIVVARFLGPDLYGVAALIISVPTLVFSLLNLRTVEPTIKYLGEFHASNQPDKALALCYLGYAANVMMALVAFLVLLLIAPFVLKHVIHYAFVKSLLVIYSVSLIFRALRPVSYAILAIHNRFKQIALLDGLITLLRTSLVIVLVVIGWGIKGVVLGNSVAAVVGGLAYFGKGYHTMRENWGKISVVSAWTTLSEYRRSILRFLFFNGVNNLLGLIPKRMDIVILGYFKSPGEVGLYKLARNLSGVVGYIVTPLQSVVYPELSRLSGLRKTIKVREKISKLGIIGLFLGVGVAVIAVPVIPLVVPWMVGKRYVSAVLPTQILIVGSAVWMALFWLRPWFMATGRIQEWTKIRAFQVLFFVIAAPLVTWRHGYIGLAVVWMMMTLLQHGIALIRYYRIKGL